MNFDHDFIGRQALERMAPRSHRRKVTLVWHRDDVLAVYAGLMEQGEIMPKYLEVQSKNSR